jgi:hypothetical protein
MADIRNPLTGRVFHQVDSTLAEILVDTGMMEYNRAAPQPSAPARPKENTFAIARTQWGKLSIVLTTPSGNVLYFGGAPEQARDAFKTLAWSGAQEKQIYQGPETPEAVIKEYAAQYQYERAVKAATSEKLNAANSNR